MKRLATVVVAIGILGLVGTARAEPSSKGGTKARACPQRAETVVRSGFEDVAYLDVGLDPRQPAPRVFVCWIAHDVEIGDRTFAGALSVWADPEYGHVGVSCAKRKGWEPVVGCSQGPVQVPGVGATTPVDHPDGPWAFHLLGINMGYAFDDATVGAAVAPGERCVSDECARPDTMRVTARRGLQYRANGWNCVGGDRCGRSDDIGATVGEQDEQPTLAVGNLTFDIPAVCIEASTDVRC